MSLTVVSISSLLDFVRNLLSNVVVRKIKFQVEFQSDLDVSDVRCLCSILECVSNNFIDFSFQLGIRSHEKSRLIAQDALTCIKAENFGRRMGGTIVLRTTIDGAAHEKYIDLF